MTSGRFLFLQLAVLLAIGIFLGSAFPLSNGESGFLLLVAVLFAIAFFYVRRGGAAFLALCACFVLFGSVRAQLPDAPYLPASLAAWGERLAAQADVLVRSLGLNEETTALARAMLLGQRDHLSPSVIRLYRLAGASHVLALSGLHQGVLFGCLSMLLVRLSDRRWRVVAGMVELLLMWGYALLAGFPLSLCRATLMMSVFVVAQMRMEGNDSWHTLGLSAFLLLLLAPGSLFDIGFQLSFSAVAGILLFYRPLTLLGVPNRNLWLWGGWKAWLVSLSAQLGVFPLLLHYFHAVPLSSFLLSPFYVLLATLFLYVLLLLLALPLGCAVLLGPVAEGLVSVQHGVMHGIVSLSLGYVTDVSLPWPGVLLLYGALFCCLPVITAMAHQPLCISHYRLAQFFRSWPYVVAALLLLLAVWLILGLPRGE